LGFDMLGTGARSGGRGLVGDAVEGLAVGHHLLSETHSGGEDAEGAIEALVDLDAGKSVAGAVPRSRDVDEVGRKAHGVVVAHHASIFETEDLVEATVLRPRQPRRVGVLGGDHKTAVVAGASLKNLVGVARGASLGKAKLADEAVLEGSPQPFHAAFGPW
jgi:hypothetical protein